jgi:uncharacterized membrane protein YsdA (DUF1294 family)
MTILVAAAYIAVISFATFLVFAWDKHCARNGRWRVPERTLLGMAAIGGTLGAIAAQHGLRHKTRKEPFRTHLYLIAGAQVVVPSAMLIPAVRDAILSAIS